MVKKIGCIIQARMGSTRLPGKVLKVLGDKTVLGHIIARLKNARNIDQIIVATSENIEDNRIADECRNHNVECFRGSNTNVLKRYFEAAVLYKLTDVVRVCADNALVDWEIIDNQISIYKKNYYDIVATGNLIPLGLGGEIFSFEKLQSAFENAKEDYQREHVTPYIYETSKSVFRYQIDEDYSKYRFTLDTPQDWSLILKIYDFLYKGNHDFTLREVIEVMRNNPELYEFNKDVKQINVLK